MEMSQPKLELRIARGTADQTALLPYDVPYREGMSLLDAIFWIREHEDPSLAVRYSCRSANACKECTAIVDGKVAFLCSVRAQAGQAVIIEPLKGRSPIKDLATELD